MQRQPNATDIVKYSMNRILEALGFTNICDKTTIIPADSFDRLDSELVMAAIREYRVSFWNTEITITPMDEESPRSKMTAETKFATINRILAFKHEMIIDSVKDIDGIESEGEHGYRLEIMPSGY